MAAPRRANHLSSRVLRSIKASGGCTEGGRDTAKIHSHFVGPKPFVKTVRKACVASRVPLAVPLWRKKATMSKKQLLGSATARSSEFVEAKGKEGSYGSAWLHSSPARHWFWAKQDGAVVRVATPTASCQCGRNGLPAQSRICQSD